MAEPIVVGVGVGVLGTGIMGRRMLAGTVTGCVIFLLLPARLGFERVLPPDGAGPPPPPVSRSSPATPKSSAGAARTGCSSTPRAWV